MHTKGQVCAYIMCIWLKNQRGALLFKGESPADDADHQKLYLMHSMTDHQGIKRI